MSAPHPERTTPTPLRRTTTRSGRWIVEDPGNSGDADCPAHHAAALPKVAPHLVAATALLDAATRMHDSRDPDALLDTIAAEASDLIDADGVLICSRIRTGWTPSSGASQPERVRALGAWCAALADAELLEPGEIPDLDARLVRSRHGEQPAPQQPQWRSVLVVDLYSPKPSTPTRLLWYSYNPGTFSGATSLAELFARHAGLARQVVSERHHLQRAVEASTITGQAVGILMSRHHLTADQAFTKLRTHSQHQNIKVRALAQSIIDTGETL